MHYRLDVSRCRETRPRQPVVTVPTLYVQLLTRDSHCPGNYVSVGVHDWRASGRRRPLGLPLTYWMGVSQVEGRRAVLWVEGTGPGKDLESESSGESGKEETTSRSKQGQSSLPFRKSIFLERGCQKRPTEVACGTKGQMSGTDRSRDGASQVARNLRSSRDKMGVSRENKGSLISLCRGPRDLKRVRSGGLSSLEKIIWRSTRCSLLIIDLWIDRGVSGRHTASTVCDSIR